jgi:hypothetical protein
MAEVLVPDNTGYPNDEINDEIRDGGGPECPRQE